MSGARLPMLPWFHGEFLVATQGWNLAEVGAYCLLLGAQWETGPLSLKPPDLARICRVSGRQFATLWPTVGKQFARTEEGYVNRPLEMHRKKAIALKKAASERAEKAARARWGDPKGDAPSNALSIGEAMLGAMLEQCSPSPSPSVRENSEAERARAAVQKPRRARQDGNGICGIDEADPEVQRRRREAAELALLQDGSPTEGNA